jgi:hypothetical protein
MHIRGFVSVLGVLVGLFAGCSSGSSSGGGASCSQICSRAKAANCPTPETDCEGKCAGYIKSTSAACKSKLDTLSSCLSGATFKCDANGSASACESQATDWANCVAQSPGTGGSGGNGGTGGSGGSSGSSACAAQSGDDACVACTRSKCCTAFKNCSANTDCAAVASCYGQCDVNDDACFTNCADAHPSGDQLFSKVITCLDAQCSTECQ